MPLSSTGGPAYALIAIKGVRRFGPALGLCAPGLRPRDPARYEIFGEPVLKKDRRHPHQLRLTLRRVDGPRWQATIRYCTLCRNSSMASTYQARWSR
jgi:hypothetical protein